MPFYDIPDTREYYPFVREISLEIAGGFFGQVVVSLRVGELRAGVQLASKDQKWQKILKVSFDVKRADTAVEILDSAWLRLRRMPDLGVLPVIGKD